ncbi:alpha/beta fold hydrolase [Actinomarinicola tropica]|uniref:Alpha/beta fold hydrolase n=1 Tax=Actinomarinicola tropica TaxID=2789776 RepID=A0A5Q2RAZ6_9ACTN|nr:alpha/beta hydrolase [Actinomarinicola tropica]QGG93998.1 alpha/beta fold hydrolase [Actinomarinicola tropica]
MSSPVAPELRRIRTDAGLTVVLERFGHASDRPPVLLLHGGGQTRHSWAGTAARLAERGYEAWTMDLRGHGDSDWATDGDYTTDAMVEDLDAVCAEIGRPPVLVGASMGGMVGLVSEGSLRPGRLRALVLVDIATQLEHAGVERIVGFMSAAPDGFATLEEAADAIAAYRPNRPRPSNLDGLRKNLRQGEDGRWRWHWDPAFLSGKSRDGRSDIDTLGDAARNLALPTLLVRGRMSDMLSLEGVATFREQCPHARFVDIADAGHMVVGDRNDAFTDAVIDFVDQLGADGGDEELAS